MTHYISPPFWGSGGDPDVRLWVPFTGNVSTDISSYTRGAGTNSGATITGGQLVVSGTGVQTIEWTHASLALTASAWTLECFMTWTSSDNFVQPGGDLQYTHTSNTYCLHVFSNAGKIALDTPAFGTPDAGPSATNVLSGTGKVHIAMVRPAGAGAQTIRCYAAGAQQFTYLELGAPGTLTSGTVTIGKVSGAGNASVAIDDVRLTLRERYTGTSFTPPTSPLS